MTEIRSSTRRAASLGAAGLIGGVAMATAGLLHLALAPVHLEHTVQHGYALYAVGVADVVWTVVWLRRRSRITAWAGIALSIGSLYLYAVTRVVPLPFEGEPEAIDGFGLATQLCEAAAFASLAAVSLMRGTSARRLTAVMGSAVGGASFVLAAASCASLVSGSGP